MTYFESDGTLYVSGMNEVLKDKASVEMLEGWWM
jgi:hypothetical protein